MRNFATLLILSTLAFVGVATGAKTAKKVLELQSARKAA